MLGPQASPPASCVERSLEKLAGEDACAPSSSVLVICLRSTKGYGKVWYKEVFVMAVVTHVDQNKTFSDELSIRQCLAEFGIDYERWQPSHDVAADSSAEEVLNAYAAEIETLKTRGGYVTADVIDVTPDTPGLEAMLAKFDREHWHDEDEVRFIISGHGLFHVHGDNGVVAIEVGPGDLIR